MNSSICEKALSRAHEQISGLQTKVDELKISHAIELQCLMEEKDNEYIILRKERDFYEEKNRACHKISLGFLRERDTLQESEAALKVMVERLRGELKKHDTYMSMGVPRENKTVTALLAETPTQSLQSFRDEAIDECAQRADFFAVMLGLDIPAGKQSKAIGESIRSLKGNVG